MRCSSACNCSIEFSRSMPVLRSENRSADIENVPLATPPRADLHDAAAADDHGDHGRAAFRTIRGSCEMCVAVRAKEVRLGTDRDLLIGFHIVAAVQRRKPDVAVHAVIGEGHANRRVSVHRVIGVHQAVVAARATNLHGEDAFVGLYLEVVQSDASLLAQCPPPPPDLRSRNSGRPPPRWAPAHRPPGNSPFRA